ncbi:MAG: DMT family transporter [Pseudomonadota bacterium]
MTKPSSLSWCALIALGLIWGAAFMFAKLALSDFGPKTLTALRLVIGAVLLLVIAYASGNPLPDPRKPENHKLWIFIIGMGVMTNVLPFNLLNWGQQYVTSSFAGISMAVVPLLVLPLAHFLVPGEHLTPRRIIGFVIGFIGTVILVGPETFFSSTGDSLEPMGRLACVATACCYAIGSIITRLAPTTSMIAFSAGGLAVAAVLAVPFAIAFEGVPPLASFTSWSAAVYLGLMATGAATLMLVWTIQTAGPTFMSLVNYQVPVWAVILGTVILGETLPVQFVAALALIMLGLLVSQKGLATKLRALRPLWSN